MRFINVNITKRTQNLMDYANGLGSGYVKSWKALGILGVLLGIPEIYEDWERILEYVKSCLKMEGFSDQHCELIAIFLIQEHIDALRAGEIREYNFQQMVDENDALIERSKVVWSNPKKF